MKKTILALTVALVLGVSGSAGAMTLINRNSCDDCGIFTNVANQMFLGIDVDNKVFSHTQVYTNASTGGSGIFAGDDVLNASIESDDASNDTTVTEEVGSVAIQYVGADGAGSSDIAVSDNSNDDAVIAANEANDVAEVVEVESSTFTSTDLVAESKAGDMTIAAGEDVQDAGITTGKATTKFVANLLKGSVLVQRLLP